MHVVLVEMVVKPGHLEPFLVLIKANAQASLTTEPGCRQFDVCQDVAEPSKVLLYEVYDSEQAFSDHLATDHFLRFDRETAHMLARKMVHRLERLMPA